jgi:glycosyltransferase involved in cell wall biosynthesis
MIGLIPEPPFDPRSWSGSSAWFFAALKEGGVIDDAYEVALSPAADRVQKLRAFAPSLPKWRAKYHASIPRFEALSRRARELGNGGSTLQVGAWFRGRDYSYHDGNSAMWYRHYGGLLGDRAVARHLSFEREVYDGMRGILVMSAWLADSFLRDFGQKSEKVHVVGAGVNLPTPPVIERSWETPRFMIVGRDFARKGGQFLLEAFKQVRREVPDAELVIVGPDLNLEMPGVSCPGLLSKANPEHQQRLDKLFRQATCMVLPSIYEPFGISLTEGMIYGLPCVTVDRCAMPEIVQHGKTGLVARPGDAASLAAAMIEIAKNPVQGKEFGAAGRARALSNYTWRAVAEKIGDITHDK